MSLIVSGIVFLICCVGNLDAKDITFSNTKIFLWVNEKSVENKAELSFLDSAMVIVDKSDFKEERMVIPYDRISRLIYGTTKIRKHYFVIYRKNLPDKIIIQISAEDALNFHNVATTKTNHLIELYDPLDLGALRNNALTRKELIEKYFGDRQLDPIEGTWVWDDNSYEVCISKNNTVAYPQYEYYGIIVDTRKNKSNIGKSMMFLKETASDQIYSTLFFPNTDLEQGTLLVLQNKNLGEITVATSIGLRKESHYIVRTYPKNSDKSPVSKSTGSGFFISESIVVTNFHVVENATSIKVNCGGRKIDARLIIKDSINDIALLDTDRDSNPLPYDNTRPLPLGNPGSIKEGNIVYTVGYPLSGDLGIRPRVSEGIINSTTGLDDDPRMFQVSIPIQPGNSGGPLFDINGVVVGVITSTLKSKYFLERDGLAPQNVGFAIKINYLTNLLSVLPENLDLAKNESLTEYTVSELMDKVRDSVVLIEVQE
jgi:S1-C subfamily serine protease